MAALLSVCPCELLIVIVKLTLIGNCSLLNSKGKFDGIMGIRGINTISPLPHPDVIQPSTTFFWNDTTRSLVPLQSFDALKLRSGVTLWNRLILGFERQRVEYDHLPIAALWNRLILGFERQPVVSTPPRYKVCELHFSDEAIRRYTKGGNILGMAYNSEQAATSAYVLMIQSLLSPLKEIVHIMPVKKNRWRKIVCCC
ncbi:hypothetical protein TNCV_3574161 [Trichonephila clavipes]|nr:hypothetical protein TNCV_3574161 [Trichonephila clavipes]